MMARMRLDDVLMRLDEDSDNDFDGYLEDDELRDTDGGDSSGSDSEDHGNSSNSDDIDGHMSVDGDSDGSERRQQRVRGRGGRSRGRPLGQSRGRGGAHSDHGHMSMDFGNGRDSDSDGGRGRGRSGGRGRGHSSGGRGLGHSTSRSRGRGRGRDRRAGRGAVDSSRGNTGPDVIPTIPSFSGSPGCTQDMTDKSPVEFFQLLLPDDLLQVVVDQTNLFARQYIDTTELSRFSKVREWEKRPHNLAELKKFLTIIIVMGFVELPQIEDAWSTKWPFATTTFSTILKRDRFSLILRFLHLSDSSLYIPKGQPGYDPLYKLRPFMDPLLDNIKAACNLGREIAIDESMIGFKGRLHFIQYMPDKPTKWGMKAFVLANSRTGYAHTWRLL